MRPALATSAGLLLLLTTACGGGDDPSVSSSSSPSAAPTTSAPAAPLDKATLKKALIIAADVPAGFKSVPLTEDDDEKSGEECLDFLSSLAAIGDDATASAEVEFEKSDDEDAGAGHLLASYADEAGATAVLDEIKSKLATCTTFSSEAEGLTIKGSITKLGLTGLSPDGIAFNATASFSGAGVPATPFAIDYSVARVGTTLSAIAFSDGGAAPIDHKLTQGLGAKAYANLQAAAG